MITHSASGALITPEEEQKVWFQRQINQAVSEITGEPYHDPMEPRSMVTAREPETLKEWVKRLLGNAPIYSSLQELWEVAIDSAPLEGLYCEFGVGDGKSLRTLAGIRPEITLYGFDWFHGLPIDGGRPEWPRGRFSRMGEPPYLPANVELCPGLFQDMLPGFLRATPFKAAFLHFDCDLYESAAFVLQAMRPRIVPGTILLFDEFWGFEGWERLSEARAFYEFQQNADLKIECLGVHQEQVLFRIRI